MSVLFALKHVQLNGNLVNTTMISGRWIDCGEHLFRRPLVGIAYSCGGSTNDSQGGRSYETILDGFGHIECLSVSGETLYFCGATSTELPGVYSVALPSGSRDGREIIPERLIGTATKLTHASISRPSNMEFDTGENEKAYAFFYPPTNSRLRTEGENKPPLIVGVHGGPTSAARAVLNLKVQFWTSRGFAFLDVNHRGSTGWEGNIAIGFIRIGGVVDIEDIENGVRHVIDEGFVAPDRIAIRGGSAGGYSVMACLANSNYSRRGQLLWNK